MTIQSIFSHWHNNEITTFVTDDFHASVQVEYPRNMPELGYIYNLWVEEGYRRKGYAAALLDAAEEHIALQCKQKAVIDWDKRDTPEAILKWYMRRGFEETEFGIYTCRLEKKIES